MGQSRSEPDVPWTQGRPGPVAEAESVSNSTAVGLRKKPVVRWGQLSRRRARLVALKTQPNLAHARN
jgi:hypothetical protein